MTCHRYVRTCVCICICICLGACLCVLFACVSYVILTVLVDWISLTLALTHSQDILPDIFLPFFFFPYLSHTSSFPSFFLYFALSSYSNFHSITQFNFTYFHLPPHHHHHPFHYSRFYSYHPHCVRAVCRGVHTPYWTYRQGG